MFTICAGVGHECDGVESSHDVAYGRLKSYPPTVDSLCVSGGGGFSLEEVTS